MATLHEMNHRVEALAGSALLVALVIGGCAGGASSSPPQDLAATTHGLSYKLEVTTSGNEQCTTASYRSALPTGQPILQGSHLCESPADPGHAVLVQARGSAESMVTDVSATCGTVRGGVRRTTLRPLVTRCTTGRPAFRVTILPAARRLFIVGIPKLPVINFPRHRCKTGICITPLT
jgi:hypothetical protein